MGEVFLSEKEIIFAKLSPKFSPNFRDLIFKVFARYMGGLAEDALPDFFPAMANPTHEAKMMVKYLIPWHCQMENDYCLR